MRKRLLALGATAAMLLLAACSGGGSGSASTAGGGATGGVGGADTLTLGEMQIPASWDVNGLSTAHQEPYFSAVYDSLLRQDGSGNLVPGLATAWAYNDKKTELTLTLRTGVKFTDGTDFDASAVVANLDNFRKSTTSDLSNAQYITDVAAVDTTHVLITLSAPDPMLTRWMTGTLGWQMSPKSFTAADAKTNPVGSGPYTLDTAKTVNGSVYVFNKNPNYWDSSYHVYKTLTIKYFSTQASLLNALLGKQLDASTYLDFSTLAQVKSAGYTLNKNQIEATGLIFYDRDGTRDAPLGKLKVRQAINYAIDRDGILKAIENGEGTTTSSWFGSGTKGFDPTLDSYYSYDVNKAKQMLADAGYPNGFTLEMPSTSGLSQSLFTTIQQELAAVGITVKYTDTGTNFVTDLIAGKYTSSYMQLTSAIDWQFAQLALVPNAVFNPFHTKSDTTDALFTKMQAGDAASEQAAKELNRYTVENAWFAPFFRINNYWASNSSVKITMIQDNVTPPLYMFQPAA